MSDVPNSTARVQQEACQTTKPTSESLMFALGGPINYALTQTAKVGDVVMSALDDGVFQSQRDGTWVLADGRTAVGSEYQTLTSQTSVPDFRGVFPRGKDHTRGINPNGNLPIGTQTADQFGAHTHSVVPTVWGDYSGTGGAPDRRIQGDFNPTLATPLATNSQGGTETAPKSVTINFFIKINP